MDLDGGGDGAVRLSVLRVGPHPCNLLLFVGGRDGNTRMGCPVYTLIRSPSGGTRACFLLGEIPGLQYASYMNE